ncbi:MAG: B12-binding domain-containing radical SAM protein [Treponema sp.]|nr:B12-binding domain-containing radical SAM protein [Treponema sp.]
MFKGPASGGPAVLLTTINAKWIHPSLALRLLKANLGSLEGDCEILEFALRQPLAEKLGAIQSRRPKILGISLSIWNHSPTLELLKALDGAWGEPAQRRPLVVLGGPEASYLPAEAEIFRYADYVIRGEGEEAFRKLCETLLDGAEGHGAVQFINGAQADPGRIRQAYHYYSDEDLARKMVYVESVRGCPFRCGFCQSAAAGAVREFPLASFLSEMDTLIKRGARNFKFLDRSFNADTGRALEIMDFFLRHIEAGPRTDLCVHFEMFPGFFPPALREKLRRFPAGSLRLEIGIQTLNPQAAALVNRPVGGCPVGGTAGSGISAYGSSGEGAAALEILRFLHEETRATVHADLIAALPGENIDSFAEGFDRLWLALSGPAVQGAADTGNIPAGRGGHVEIQLGILKVLPGTPLAQHSAAWGIRYAPAPPYEALSTAALPGADLDRIKNFARFWELLINRRPFPELPIIAPGKPVFRRFMDLSGRLLARFGRNWGIDRQELRAAVVEMTQGPL